MKEKLNSSLIIRMTPELKKRFVEYCKNSGYCNHSVLVRVLISEKLKKEAF